MKSKNLDIYKNIDGFECVTIGEKLEKWAKQYGEKIAVREGSSFITYLELLKQSDILAHKMIKMGIRKDDRVVLQLPNSIYFVKVFFGLLRMGAIPVLVLPAHREMELNGIFETTKAVAYIAPTEYFGYEYQDLGKTMANKYPFLKHILVGDECLSEVNVEDSADVKIPKVQYDDIAIMLLSGGTTGIPKLIPRTHADYLYNAKMAAQRSEMDMTSVYLAALSVEHNMPLACPGILGTFLVGGTVVMCHFPSADEILELIMKEKVTVTGLVPAIVSMCTELLEYDEYDISSLKVLLVGGAKLDEKLAKKILKVWKCRLQNLYGTAEGLIAATKLGDPVDVVISSQGKPISKFDQIKILDEFDKEVPRGEIGELVTKGPYTIVSYFKQENQKAYFTEDGYYRTGDKARITLEGNLQILGRIREQINRGGEKILPSEIEGYLLELVEIKEAVVVAAKDDELGERICAFLVIKEGSAVNIEKIRDSLREKGVSEYKLPDQIEFVEKWPVTKFGKVDRNQLMTIANLKGKEN